ncbi:MAG: ABC transporter ATP-binding protein [Spirochaetota bacterium]
MDYYQEEDERSGKLYSREVLRLLFRYILVYKRYLIIALVFVLFITGSNISVPFLFKVIIDRYIFKQGRIVDVEMLRGRVGGVAVLKRVNRRIKLTDKLVFLYQSDLKFFSRKEIEDYTGSGIFSKETFILVDSDLPEVSLKEKLERLKDKGYVRIFKPSLLLITSNALEEFSVAEIIQLRREDFVRTAKFIFFIIIILLVQFASNYLQIIFLMRLSQNAMRDLRRDLFSHILRLEVSFYDKNPIGRLVNRVTNDVEKLNELFSSVLITLFQDILMLLGIALVMFLTNLTLALIVATTFPFLIFFTILFRIKVRSAYRMVRSRISDLNSFLNETITGIRIVQIFVRELNNFKRFLKRNTDVYNAQLKQLYANAVFRPLIGFLMWFGIAAVIYFGAEGIVQNRLSYGLIVMFIAYIERFFHPIQDLSEKFDIMQSANAAGEKILSILKADALKEDVDGAGNHGLNASVILQSRGMSVSDSAGSKQDWRFKGHIIFDDVWFSYVPGEWVLRGVSFEVNPLETLAIVGETGAGKSTIINILSRYYSIQRGRVMIDGVDIREIPYQVLRRNIASVIQDVFLFSRSVLKNIILGSPYEEHRFNTIKKITHLERFISDLPMKEYEPVMERGSTFSAGERQLLSFARALYFDPSILVLDEATSNIDSETEKLIQDAISSLIRGRTSIVIAHRLSTIKNASRIIVLERGKIVEEGKHCSLLARKGIYHKLYTLQFTPIK